MGDGVPRAWSRERGRIDQLRFETDSPMGRGELFDTQASTKTSNRSW